MSNLTGEGPKGLKRIFELFSTGFQTNRAVRLAFMMRKVRNRGLGLGARMVTDSGRDPSPTASWFRLCWKEGSEAPAIQKQGWCGSVGSTKQSPSFFPRSWQIRREFSRVLQG
jgi:hypothetical protein